VLGELLDAVARKGLIPVLKSEIYLVVAEDAYDFSGDFNFTDPSRNFTQFYAKFKEHQLAMTRLAARHGAALYIMGTELPYVAGAGERTFVDGSSMVSRRTLITSKWKDMIQAARAVAVAEGRPDMGIKFYLPGRWTDGNGNYDTGSRWSTSTPTPPAPPTSTTPACAARSSVQDIHWNAMGQKVVAEKLLAGRLSLSLRARSSPCGGARRCACASSPPRSHRSPARARAGAPAPAGAAVSCAPACSRR
jgi:hypothetical protein